MASKTSGGGYMLFVVFSGLAALVFLVLTLVFFAQVQDLTNQKVRAENDLNAAVRPNERDDRWSLLQQQAGSQGVVRYLDSSLRDTAEKVTGSRRHEADTLKQQIDSTLGEGGTSLIALVEDLRSQVGGLEQQLEQAEASRDAARSDLAAAEDRIETMQASQTETTERVSGEIGGYQQAVDDHGRNIESMRSEFVNRVQEIQSDSEAAIRSLESQIASLESQLAIANDQLRTLRNEREDDALRPSFEGALVDGRIIGTNAATGEISIDLGRSDRLVLGLTFEVYSGGASVRPMSNGEYPPGKASIEIVRIDSSSAMARVIRRTSGNPIIVGDVIANAVYDPNKTYGFAVFGNFDTNDDGIWTPQERQDIESLIIEWGGTVSTEVRGDTDFVVLGRRPVLPPEPRPNDPVEIIQRYLLMQQELQTYDDMFAQAEATGIPVLNENRLQTLTGLRGRR